MRRFITLLVSVSIALVNGFVVANCSSFAQLSSAEMRSSGANPLTCQCPVQPCITYNPQANSKGSKDCTKAGDSCTSCITNNGSEDIYQPYDICGSCNGANKWTSGTNNDCTGMIGTGTCQTSMTLPWGFICGNMKAGTNNCLQAGVTLNIMVPQP